MNYTFRALFAKINYFGHVSRACLSHMTKLWFCVQFSSVAVTRITSIQYNDDWQTQYYLKYIFKPRLLSPILHCFPYNFLRRFFFKGTFFHLAGCIILKIWSHTYWTMQTVQAKILRHKYSILNAPFIPFRESCRTARPRLRSIACGIVTFTLYVCST